MRTFKYQIQQQATHSIGHKGLYCHQTQKIDLLPRLCGIGSQYQIEYIWINYINMNDQDSIFSSFLRSIYKWLYHLITGTTQIERASRRNDLTALQTSVARSKVLSNFKANHCTWEEPFNEDIINQLLALKHISNQDAQFRVRAAFEELYCWKHALKKLEDIRQTKYDSTSQMHEKCLQQIWESLRPLRFLKARKSVEWIQLGFQADDPATDFRGSGLLGLLNLHTWVGKTEGKESFVVADTKGTDYFFASASIYLTMLSMEIVRQRYVPAAHWVGKSEDNILPSFQRIYEEVFRQFNGFWLQVEDKSLMQFNTNLISFSKKMKAGLVNKIVNRVRE